MSNTTKIVRKQRVKKAVILATSGLAISSRAGHLVPAYGQTPYQYEWYRVVQDGDPSNDIPHGVGLDVRTQDEGGLSCRGFTETGNIEYVRYGWWNSTSTTLVHPYGPASWDGVGEPNPNNFFSDLYYEPYYNLVHESVQGIFAYRPLGSTDPFTLANVTSDLAPTTFPAMSEGFFILPNFSEPTSDLPRWDIGAVADRRPGGLDRQAEYGTVTVYIPSCNENSLNEIQQVFYPEPITVSTCYYDNADGLTRTAVYDWRSSAPFDYDWPAGSAEPLNQQYDTYLDSYRQNLFSGNPRLIDIGQPVFFPAGGSGEFLYVYTPGDSYVLPPTWRIDWGSDGADPCPERAPIVETTTSTSTTSTTSPTTSTSPSSDPAKEETTSKSPEVDSNQALKNTGSLPNTGSNVAQPALFGIGTLFVGLLMRLRIKRSQNE